MSGHPAAVLRRAATLAPSVLPPGLAEIAADEIGIELSQLDSGASVDGIDERIFGLAQEILSLLPADYATRAHREIEAAGWLPWSAEVAADLLHLLAAWESQGPGPEALILLAQVRQLVHNTPSGAEVDLIGAATDPEVSARRAHGAGADSLPPESTSSGD